jgi:hypothetical protein
MERVMSRGVLLLVASLSGLALGGCVPSLLASAAGAAIQSAQPKPQSNAHLKPAAQAACTQNAAQYGTVHIIDVVQRSVDRIIVWGTVDDGKKRRSFECGFKTTVTYFKLRDIQPVR